MCVNLTNKMMMMAHSHLDLVLAAFVFFFFFFLVNRNCLFKSKNSGPFPRSWPLIGMLPTLVLNFHRLPERLLELLEGSNGTIQINGGLLCAGINMLATCDPANVSHVSSKNFPNYPKLPEFPQAFDTLGDSLFTLVKSEEWKLYRTLFHHYFTHKQTQKFLENVLSINIKKGLIPVLDHVSEQGLVVDLQDLIKRHMNDFGCWMSTGYNPNTLNIDFSENVAVDAVDYVAEVAFSRFMIPEYLWKLQRLLGIGVEKKLRHGQEALRDLVMKCVSMKREKLEELGGLEEEEGGSFDFLECMLTNKDKVFGSDAAMQDLHDETIRDNILGFMFASQGTVTVTLTWFFYLLSRNPSVETKIREEIRSDTDDEDQVWVSHSSSKLTYLHAALCETLRLYPPPPFLMRVGVEGDTLPTGHRVNEKSKVLLSPYAMGRMKWIWGEDCHEFKPERWIDEKGEIKHEPLSKFFAFSAGPRVCLGKSMAFKIMKSVTKAIILNYHVQVLDCPVVPAKSIIFAMKHGLSVKFKSSRFVNCSTS